jgi:UDP-N-acetylmuramyl pentapeptide phosphotransferase/UDP-N-acetylglucosamine-1-phosphate transferase
VRTLVALVAGAVAGAVLWRGLQPTLALPLFERENYRGHRLPVAAGLVVVLAALVSLGVWTVVLAAWPEERLELAPLLAATAIVAAGFGLLGLVDDLAGSGASRGFGGHLRALAEGRLTTGIIKLAGGAVVSILAIGASGLDVVEGFDGVAELVARALVVALAANLGNLFDRAPGRAIKVSLGAFALTALVVRDDVRLAAPAVVLGAGLGLIVPDLRERCMLGDTGANVLGGAAGLALTTSVSTTAAWIVALALAALNLASERVSFSRVIDRVAPLRWMDRLGRPG